MFGMKKEPETFAPAVKAEPVAEPEEPVVPETPAPARPCTLIGPGIKFEGNIEASEDIEINGRVEGNINSGNTITVTEEGSILGDVAAENLILEGSCDGNARIKDFCRIGAKGYFHGELRVSSLVTEDGSEFEGTLHLKKEKAEPAMVWSQSEAAEEPAPAEENTF